MRDAALRSIYDLADIEAMTTALAHEAALGPVAPTGDYWNCLDELDPARLSEIDGIWRSSLDPERIPAVEEVTDCPLP